MKEFEDILEEINHNLEWCDDAYQSRCYRRSHDEIIRLRADLDAVTEERDRMRALLVCLYDAAGPLDADKMPADNFAQIITIVLDARAALEGVTEPAPLKAETEFFVFDEFAILPEPASPWRDIESAPKDGTKIVVGIYFDGGKYPEEARWDFWVDSWRKYASGYGEGFGKPARPTVWMPLPEPPK